MGIAEAGIPVESVRLPKDEHERDPKNIRLLIDVMLEAPEPTAEFIEEVCKVHGIAVITPGEYKDWLFAYQHERRVKAVLPLIVEQIAKWNYTNGVITDDERRELVKKNTEIELRICEIMEDYGVLYQEISLMTEELGDCFKSILLNAGNRMNNMCAEIMAKITQDKFGKPLALKPLAEAHRELKGSKRTDA